MAAIQICSESASGTSYIFGYNQKLRHGATKFGSQKVVLTHEEMYNFHDMMDYILQVGFLIYVFRMIVLSLFLLF